MDWKSDLAKFKIFHAKVLYMIYYLFKANKINYTQKINLKQIMMQEDSKFKPIFIEFEKKMDLHFLIKKLLELNDENKPKNEINIKELRINIDKKPDKNALNVSLFFIQNKNNEYDNYFNEDKDKNQNNNVIPKNYRDNNNEKEIKSFLDKACDKV